MRLPPRCCAPSAALAIVVVTAPAHAQPPTLRARASLRHGLSIEGCTTARDCRAWVRFPRRPYREFVAAAWSPAAEHFYVWSRPDGGAREVDVFEAPRDGALARRVGHWVPGAGGELRWVGADRLWHVWGCGAACLVAALYNAAGATLVLAHGAGVDVSADGHHAVVAGGNAAAGVVIDIDRGTTRPFGLHANARCDGFPSISWQRGDVTVSFAPPDDADDVDAYDERCSVRVLLDDADGSSSPP